MAFSQKRRFVAGAVCPRCSAMDKLVVYRENEKDFRECVECGFHEEMKVNVAASELPTRVNQPDANDSETSVIRIFDQDAHNKSPKK